MSPLKLLSIAVIGLFLLDGCSRQKNTTAVQNIVIAISGDIDTFNPLFAATATAGEINELIYPSLVSPAFDTAAGVLHFSPALAKSYEFSNQNKDIIFHIRTDVVWSDSVRVTTKDIQLSYSLYGNPDVGSVRQSALEGLLRTKSGSIDIKQSIEIQNDSTVVFHFAQTYPGQLFDAGLPIFPAHIFENIPLKELRTHAVNRNPTGAGPYLVKSWKPMEEIILQPNPLSVLIPSQESPSLIFRIIPEYRSQVNQISTGEINMMMNIESVDASDLTKKSSAVKIIRVPGRRFHFIGWNNIDQKAYARSKGKILQPHPLFGDPLVRQALTSAIDRSQLLSGLLNNYGMVAVGPIAPFFHWAYNDSLQSYPFDPAKALALLHQQGWNDKDNDGILEKSGMKFDFSLCVPTGSQFWSSVATIVQQQLQAIHVKVSIKQVERSIYWQDLIEKKYDAWIAGFEIPLQIQLQEFWGSDLHKNPFNVSSYQNDRVDFILKNAQYTADQKEAGQMWREFQTILHRDQPFTFLFWEDRLVALDARIQGTDINVLGTLPSAWKWRIE